jgi:hypothetical protein
VGKAPKVSLICKRDDTPDLTVSLVSGSARYLLGFKGRMESMAAPG